MAEDRTAAINEEVKTVKLRMSYQIFYISKEFQLNADGPALLLTSLSIIKSRYFTFKINGKDILKACKHCSEYKYL